MSAGPSGILGMFPWSVLTSAMAASIRFGGGLQRVFLTIPISRLPLERSIFRI